MKSGVETSTRRIAVAVVSALAFSLSGIAQAAEPAKPSEPAEERPDDYTDPGFYVGIGVPLGIGNFSADVAPILAAGAPPWLTLPPGPMVLNDSFGTRPAFGVRAYAGYKVSRFLAVEGEYEWLATRFKMRVLGAPLLESRPWTAVGNVKGYLLEGKVQPFVKFGAGWTSNAVTANLPEPVENPIDPDDIVESITGYVSGPVIRMGGGVELYGTEHAAVSVDFSYVMPFGAADGFDYWSIGLFNLQYRF